MAEMPLQPQTLNEVDVLNSLYLTLNGYLFLIEDLELNNNNRILVFITKTNMQCLSQAPYWVIDNIFKTVSTVFWKIYTIHAPV
ncbi:7181_t:CDS:1, partial [Cetraspora pellucida]